MNTSIDDLTDIFEIRTANESIRAAKEKPVPKPLFGDFWLEGELAILFADTGVGKSLLAVQIAETIATGKPFAPLKTATKPQKVLYLDFELSDKQFEMRYASEHEPERGECLKNHYRFSDRFLRVTVRPEAMVENESRSFEAVLRRLIEPLVKRTGARVLIVDNITYLKRTAESTRETAPLMKELKRLKEELGLSILVLAHTPKRDTRRHLTVNDLAGSKILANFADNIFAIGASRLDAACRYVKHIKPRSTELVYGAAHVPTFRITRLQRNFLGFKFQQFLPEADHLADVRDQREWETIRQIKQLHDSGMTLREIGEKLGISKTTAHRLLQMWPEEWTDHKREAADVLSPGLSRQSPGARPPEGGTQNAPENARPVHKEEYHGQHTDWYLVSIGMKPVWWEKHLKELQSAGVAELQSGGGAASAACELTSDLDDMTDAEAIDALCAQFADQREGMPADPDFPPLATHHSPLTVEEPTASPPLTVRLDAAGREIYVEEECPATGRPMIWYKTDSSGTHFRHVRSTVATIATVVDSFPR